MDNWLGTPLINQVGETRCVTPIAGSAG